MQPRAQLPNKVINSSISQSPSPCRGNPGSPTPDKFTSRIPATLCPNLHLLNSTVTIHSQLHSNPNNYNYCNSKSKQTTWSSPELTEMLSKIQEIYAAITEKHTEREFLPQSDQPMSTPSLLARSNRKLSKIKQELGKLHRPSSSQLPLFLKEKVAYLENELEIKINRLEVMEAQNNELMKAVERAACQNNKLSTEIEALRDNLKQMETAHLASPSPHQLLGNWGFKPSQSAGPELFTPNKPTPKEHELPSFVCRSQLAKIQEYHNESEDSTSNLRLSQSIFEPERSPSPIRAKRESLGESGSPQPAPNTLLLFEQRIREIKQCITSCLEDKEPSTPPRCSPSSAKNWGKSGEGNQKCQEESTAHEREPPPWKKVPRKRKGFEKTKSVTEKSGECQKENSDNWSSSQATSQVISNSQMSVSREQSQCQLDAQIQ